RQGGLLDAKNEGRETAFNSGAPSVGCPLNARSGSLPMAPGPRPPAQKVHQYQVKDEAMATPKCTLTATLHARPEKRGELMKLLESFVPTSRAEPGCIEY